LKLKCDILVSNFVFKLILYRYSKAAAAAKEAQAAAVGGCTS
jgi:hypothetical protein